MAAPSPVSPLILSRATAQPVERGRRKLGSIGLPAPYNEVAVLDETLRPLPPGEPGEICVRPVGEMVRLWRIEYLDDPDATARLWRGGWLHTGDQGVADAEGFLTFIDRPKDVIRRRGENVSSQQVEHVLLAHPAVADAAVLGVPAAVGEEEVLAVVVLRTAATPEELAAFCRERLAEFKVPSFFPAPCPAAPSARAPSAKLFIRLKANDLHPVPFSALPLIADGRLGLYHGAPTAILILKDRRGVANPDLDFGIAGQNMVLAAHSMGLGTCWVSFTKLAFQYGWRWRRRLGIASPYQFVSSLAIGFPVGQPDGMVARPTVDVDWYEDGVKKVVR